MKKKRVHYNTTTAPLSYNPACGSAPHYSDRTTDPRLVTCKNCKKTHEWVCDWRALKGK